MCKLPLVVQASKCSVDSDESGSIVRPGDSSAIGTVLVQCEVALGAPLLTTTATPASASTFTLDEVSLEKRQQLIVFTKKLAKDKLDERSIDFDDCDSVDSLITK